MKDVRESIFIKHPAPWSTQRRPHGIIYILDGHKIEVGAVANGDEEFAVGLVDVVNALGNGDFSLYELEKLASGNYTLCDGYCHEFCGSSE